MTQSLICIFECLWHFWQLYLAPVTFYSLSLLYLSISHRQTSKWKIKIKNEARTVYLGFIIRHISRLYLNLSGRAIKLYLFFRLVLLLLFPWQVELGWDNSCISYYEIWFEFKLKTCPKFYTNLHIIFPVKYDLFYVQYCPFNIWKIYYSKAHFLVWAEGWVILHWFEGISTTRPSNINLLKKQMIFLTVNNEVVWFQVLFKYWKFDIFTLTSSPEDWILIFDNK